MNPNDATYQRPPITTPCECIRHAEECGEDVTHRYRDSTQTIDGGCAGCAALGAEVERLRQAWQDENRSANSLAEENHHLTKEVERLEHLIEQYKKDAIATSDTLIKRVRELATLTRRLALADALADAVEETIKCECAADCEAGDCEDSQTERCPFVVQDAALKAYSEGER